MAILLWWRLPSGSGPQEGDKKRPFWPPYQPSPGLAGNQGINQPFYTVLAVNTLFYLKTPLLVLFGWYLYSYTIIAFQEAFRWFSVHVHFLKETHVWLLPRAFP